MAMFRRSIGMNELVMLSEGRRLAHGQRKSVLKQCGVEYTSNFASTARLRPQWPRGPAPIQSMSRVKAPSTPSAHTSTELMFLRATAVGQTSGCAAEQQ